MRLKRDKTADSKSQAEVSSHAGDNNFCLKKKRALDEEYFTIHT